MGIRSYLTLRIAYFRMLTQIKGIPAFTLLLCQILSSIPGKLQSKTVKKWLASARRIYGKSLYQRKVEVNGLRFILMDEGSLDHMLPSFEKPIRRHLQVREGNVFLDIGANIGLYSLTFSRIVGQSGQVIGIEPVPDTFQALKGSIEANGFTNIIPLNVACWNRKATLRIFLGPKHGWSSLKEDWGLGHLTIQAKTVDSIVHDLGLKSVDFVKIDVEGSELEVLEGMENTLKRWKPRVVVEVSDQTMEKVIQSMKELNYESLRVRDDEGRLHRSLSLYLCPSPILM